MRRLDAGSPELPGLTLRADGANVAVFSAHATAIELCLFDGRGEREAERIRLPERTGDVFHGFVPGIAAGMRYGLRAHGPWAPHEGHRFNAAKLLVDPYARALDRAFTLHASQFDGEALNPTDSAAHVPKAIAVGELAAHEPLMPAIAWRDTVAYELHLKGYTRQHPGIPEAIRGTAAGLAHPRAVEHLVRLGVTSVEILPIAAWSDERHLPALGLTNYWGYNPVAWMAPDPRLCPGGIGELAGCVAALHAAGIEVIVDVVFNHTGEGDALGPTLSLRGLDNASYYRLHGHDRAQYVNDTGCGNTLALDSAPALRLALDTLRHYVRHAGVDGFRFDLATTLGRRAHGFDPSAPLLAAIAADPLLRDRKLIAEPWDLGPGGHQLGGFPAGWGEWNDRYRDTVRRFWRGDAHQLGGLATRLAGSSDIFAGRERPPSRSLNFVTAHDGYTLADLVSHVHKHNAANGEASRDGTDHNLSWNHGTEGPCDDPGVREARARDVRALLATLLCSRGTPMLAMGDELGRSQAGNNNAYAQDNAVSWVDWARADDGLAAYTAALLRLRRQHRALRDDRWLTGDPADASGMADVEWLAADGRPLEAADWHAPDGRALLACLYVPAGEGQPADRVIVAINGGRDPIAVRWPDPRDGHDWQRLLDSAAPDDPQWHAPGLAGRSVVVLAEQPAPRRSRSSFDPAWRDRLAQAAGIAPVWHDVAGTRHDVSPETKQALLDAMGLDVRTTAQARERLYALACQRERRVIPETLVVRAGDAACLPWAGPLPAGGRGRLRIAAEAGEAQLIDIALAALPEARRRAADGGHVQVRDVSLPALPPGRYALTDEDSGLMGCLIVAPPHCHLPASIARGERHLGLATHVYALRRKGGQGIGDFTALAEAAEATARAGGALVGINPLHALFPRERERASPYHPSDRRFLDPIYIDVTAVADFHDPRLRVLLSRPTRHAAHLEAAGDVDYEAVWSLKRDILRSCFRRFCQRPANDPVAAAFHAFVTAGGDTLQCFAAFDAIAATMPRTPWQQWPATLRHPEGRGIADFVSRHREAVDFALYLQWLADAQLGDAARRARDAGLAIGLYRDLAVGTAPDGAEAWALRDQLARAVSIGAPPDPFCRDGQVWALPPPKPEAMRSSGYAAFEQLLAANMRHAGALRIDHVMGLDRLFWVPDGGSAAEGAYVAYPREDLLGVLCLASQRAGCLVVGEDLGTVPEGLRDRLSASNVLSYRVAWFERDGGRWRSPEAYPRLAAACVSTHDLPTVAGWWAGADLDEREQLDLANDEALAGERAQRARDREDLARTLAEAGTLPTHDGPPGAPEITAGLHGFLGRTPCALTLVQADDLAQETRALNVPGTDRERPNWRRRVGVEATGLWETPIGRLAHPKG